jgi:hypothetical protein
MDVAINAQKIYFPKSVHVLRSKRTTLARKHFRSQFGEDE